MTNYSVVTNDRYRLNYHVMAPSGWINDPNGFSFFKGYYHIFYQYHPESAVWGPMHWGHARSKDLVHWENLPIALFPGDEEDQDGCFSGSAIVKDDRLYLMYTGHNLHDKNNPDDYWQNQNIAVSDDGIHFTKCQDNPVIAEPPTDNAADFRDPKVRFENGKWLVVIGSKDQQGLGRVLQYQSTDLKNWTYVGPLATAESADTQGFVWECPDLFKLAGQDILIMSPQGIKPQELKYRNLFQTIYLLGTVDSATQQLNYHEFRELDHGHDFYAPQSMLAPDGRRILFGWMDMWESDMPEQADGWAGALTFPRELHLNGDKLCMTPVQEIAQLREHLLVDEADLQAKYCFATPTKSVEYLGEFDTTAAVEVKVTDTDDQVLVGLRFDPEKQKLILEKYNDDLPREVAVTKIDDIHLLLDKSSVELFVNNGEVCFSERIYDEKDFYIETSSDAERFSIKAYQLGKGVFINE
ncbi:hypothetical protein FC84_GL000381 [Lapidilactobacillus dextrinicus DSM 20335]|uniref:Sucrose-6-phosphate hydrolase n=1 Tax=Lapidilactobacillus dextrinicus DSM 20335 TaxID=1423738 RepID=A0A0R2BRV6_9LACO|nr:sucrose-6-phosphate hydrolase [Lapidilactobacillus dextrinicus]KRM78646.1 hypothetical protein FC84_GL000381 [Lapidilactobacillus dextrinicus DSM 20335]QFG46578.1 sucrose-6-phosphate hydrolase [Lapidilactobacillus dextrinicus]